MFVKNKLNSGITVALADKSMCLLPASTSKIIKDELITDEFYSLERAGFLFLLPEVKKEPMVAVESATEPEKEVTSETTNTKKTNKGGKR